MTTYAGGGQKIANVLIGTTQAKRMYLGNTIIWMPDPPAGQPTDVTTEFKTPGNFTYTIPLWANRIDVVVIGGGQGGSNGAPIANGIGGHAGLWADQTLTLETVPETTLTLSVVVGAGGHNYNTIGGDKGPGGLSTVNGAGIHATASPAPAATNLFDPIGQAAGNHTFNGKTYTGGGAQTRNGAPGISPGGGGGGGPGFFGAGPGGKGGDGAVWIRAYQKF